MDKIKGKSVLVTGGTGSIGSAIVLKALAIGAEKVIIFSRDEIKQFLMRQRVSDPRLVPVVGDIRDMESIRKVFEEHRIDIVFHAAAMKHLVVCEDEPLECVKTNVIGTENLVRLCKQHDIQHVVGISTDKAASPANVMGASKLIAERIMLNASKTAKGVFTCVRFGNVANSRGSVIPVMVRRILDKRDIWISDPEVTRFLMRIEEAVDLVFSTMGTAHGGELFILKMDAFKLGDLGDVMTKRIAPRLIDATVSMDPVGLSKGEKLHEELLNEVDSSTLLEDDRMYMVLDHEMSDEETARRYPGFHRADVGTYSSNAVKMISNDQLEAIVLDYLKTEYGRDYC
ncbi:MAG: SDR family NAD(P)-dependent oxidoreductase [Thermoplasmata archaeon]|nr:SDR family NAD(P)-dependent oxidoreductase [Thermoplasmata archaeon]